MKRILGALLVAALLPFGSVFAERELPNAARSGCRTAHSLKEASGAERSMNRKRYRRRFRCRGHLETGF
jgi:hypothetical protein